MQQTNYKPKQIIRLEVHPISRYWKLRLLTVTQSLNAMYTTVMVLVKLTIQTKHTRPEDALTEIQEKAKCTITNTPNVTIHELAFMDYKLKK